MLEEEIPGLKDRLKQRLSSIIFVVLNNSGLRSNELAKLLKSSETAIRKDIQKINTLVKDHPKREAIRSLNLYRKNKKQEPVSAGKKHEK